MKSKHEIPNKADYMKAFSFNFIQTERTNSDLEHERNVGKIDGAFYRNFSWQIMGKQKERQLSQDDPNDIVKTKRHEVKSQAKQTTNGKLHEISRAIEHSEGKVVVQTRTDLKGRTPQRYISTCYFKPRVIPVWYTESLLLHIGSTKRSYDEKVWFKHKLQPYYWSENMTTEVNFPPSKTHSSTTLISVAEPNEHYISLEPQQIAAGAS